MCVCPFVRCRHHFGPFLDPKISRFPFDSAILAVQKGVPSARFRTRSDLAGSRSATKMIITPHQMFQRTIITHGRHNPSTKVPSGPPCPAGEMKGLEGKPDLGVDVKPLLYFWLQNTLYVKPPLSSFRDDENSHYEYFFREEICSIYEDF